MIGSRQYFCFCIAGGGRQYTKDMPLSQTVLEWQVQLRETIMTAPVTPPYEHTKWEFEVNRENAHRAHDANREFHTYVNQAAIDAANLALRTLVLINGGAAIAILTFLGGVAAKEKIDFAKVGVVAGTIEWFAIGVALAVFAMALSYLTNYAMAGIAGHRETSYVHPFVVNSAKSARWRIANICFHVAAILAAFGSLGMFMIGMFAASDAVAHLLAK